MRQRQFTRDKDGTVSLFEEVHWPDFPPWDDSSAWLDWLETNTLFTLITTQPDAIFQMRKERVGRSWCWYLYVNMSTLASPLRVKAGPTPTLTRAYLVTLFNRFLREPPATVSIPQFPLRHTNPSRLFPLLGTKLMMPQRQTADLVLPASELIPEALMAPITLVSAPAGTGKTTLVAQWLTTVQHTTLWLTLDAHDHEPESFWTYLLAALDQVIGGLFRELQPLVYEPTARWLPLLLNRCSTVAAPLIMVIDNYHLLQAAPHSLHQAVTYMVDHLPLHFHLVLVSRQIPPLPFARWRVQGRLLEIPATTLRLPQQEAARFFKRQGIPVSSREVRHLHQHIAGWISGWHLVAQALQHCPDIPHWIANFSGTCTIADYFQEEVLAGLAPTTQTFLRQTAILQQLTGPACDALTRTTGGQAQLEQLARAQIFLESLDEQRQAFRYHPLFATFLRQALQRTQPEAARDLAARASAWYAMQGDYATAITVAANYGDATDLAQTLEAASNFFLKQGDIAVLQRWIAKVPMNVVAGHPHLGVLAAYAWQMQGKQIQADAAIAQVKQQRSHLTPTERQGLTGKFLAYHALRLAMQGECERSRRVYQHMHTHLAQDDPFHDVLLLNLGQVYQQQGEVRTAMALLAEVHQRSRATQNSYFLGESLFHLAQNAYLQGRLSMVLQRCDELLGLATGHHESDCYALQSMVMYERNDLEQATAVSRTCMQRNQSHPAVALSACILALIHAGKGETTRAQELCRYANIRAQKAEATTQALVMTFTVRMHMLCEERATAIALAEKALSQGTASIHHDDVILQARLAVLQGRPQVALVSLPQHITLWQSTGCVHAALESTLIQALAYQALKQQTAAQIALQQALVLAAPGGWLRLFLDAGAPMRRLLHQLLAARPEIRSSLSSALVKAFGETGMGAPVTPKSLPSAPVPDAPSLLNDPLTEREQEILHLLRQGSPNEALAQTLGISMGTIKRHLSNIFNKLGVHNRTQAVMYAIALQRNDLTGSNGQQRKPGIFSPHEMSL